MLVRYNKNCIAEGEVRAITILWYQLSLVSFLVYTRFDKKRQIKTKDNKGGEKMAIIQMAQKLKQIHPESVMMYKVGSFYHCYGKDAYLISGMFDYLLKPTSNTVECGFSINAINKVKTKLEENKINYLLIDPRNNYYVDEENDNRNLNEYNNQFKKSYIQVKNKNQIKRITERLQLLTEDENFKNIIRKLEDVLDEN